MVGPRQRLAWTVLSLSFLTFSILIVTVPLGVRWYLHNATVSPDADLEVISGTVQVEEPGIAVPAGIRQVQNPWDLPEGSSVKTDGTSRASITFLEGSSTASLATETEIEIVRARKRRFAWSGEPNMLTLHVRGGSVTLGAAPSEQGLRFDVQTPHATASLEQGSYLIEVTNESTQVVTYNSTASVQAAGEEVPLEPRERTVVSLGSPPEPPTAAARDLIIDGEFAEPLGENWRIFVDQGGDGGGVNGRAWIEDMGDRQAVHFFRANSGGNSATVGVRQEVNKELPELANSLSLQAEVQLMYQSLPGGGLQSSEYPVILRVNYEDEYGSENHWYHGFYYQPGNHMLYGEQIAHGVWVPWRSDNLLDLLDPRPFLIQSIEVYASGHDYESLVSRVRLILE